MTFKNIIIIFLFPFIIFSATEKKTSYVDPFIGTGAHGHTYPGPSLPFGMIQLGPDTGLEGWDLCSAYHYSDRSIIGFSHTHLSGTGCLDYGDILFIPSNGKVKLMPGTKKDPDSGYRSRFSHKDEKARPGFYSVLLKDFNIGVELTVTKRAGFHKYKFTSSNNPHIVLDLKHRDKVLDSYLKIVSNNEIEGHRISHSWANEQHVYFVAKFSKPFKSAGISLNKKIIKNLRVAKGNNLVSYFTFDLKKGDEILVKVGISPVDINGARKNLEKEIPDWDFEKIRDEADKSWERSLNKIHISGVPGDGSKKTIFYTALYHSLLNPNLYMDVDGRYRGRDLKVHNGDGFDYYTLFSLWDTYRATHPLFTIIERERTLDFINTFLKQYEQGGKLPVWELSANETDTMIGYHSVSVIADAYIKGITGFDTKKALKAMTFSAESDKRGLKQYKEYGYIPGDKGSESISKTLEYAYDDWCIALFAKAISDEGIFKKYIKRAQYYKNIFDPSSGFFRPKLNGGWIDPFNPKEVNFHFTEANAWQYNFAVVHDIRGHIELLGGEKKYIKMVDDLFSEDSEMAGRKQSDITGLIGQYAHGNEPSHHIAYLYSFAGAPWKTREKVKAIVEGMYKTGPAGLCGNEDCGQMSSWYVFSTLGFYPVVPGSDMYVLGTPSFKEACLNLENGNKFKIRAEGLSDANYYVRKVMLNGKSYKKLYIQHKDIMAGGTLTFYMSSTPNKNLLLDRADLPFSAIKDNQIIMNPYSNRSKKSFDRDFSLELKSPEENGKIYYSINGEDKFLLYENPFKISKSSEIKFYTEKEGKKSRVITSVYSKLPRGKEIRLNTKYSKLYRAGGDNALIDGLKGGNDFKTGGWQGYQGVNLDVVVDLKKVKEIDGIKISFLQDIKSWIFIPEFVDFFISENGKDYKRAGRVKNTISFKKQGSVIKEFKVDKLKAEGRYIRIVGKNIGKCPQGHEGYQYDGKAWIFADEITIK
ncbi:MAG: GH92 family glycosyl hydrolase [Acidobacteriota bacterium]